MMTINLKSLGLGDCGICLRQPAKIKVYNRFNPPIKSTHPDLPDVAGVWQYVCYDCHGKIKAAP